MHYTEATKVEFPNLSDLSFTVTYTETERKSHFTGIDLHTHDMLEIYINLSGDVSFLVENNLYPLNRGDIIIAKPGQYHHCVYRSDAKHQLFWMLIDCNNDLLDFFNRSAANFVSIDEESREEIINCCYRLLDKEASQLDKTYSFLRFMTLLKANLDNRISDKNNLPKDLANVLDYIDKHISDDLRIANIAEALYLSQSTIERRFVEYLHIKPLEFIRKRKMILAAEYLKSGKSVLEAGTDVGYSDNSHFIKLFKEYYGTTPYKFKKRL